MNRLLTRVRSSTLVHNTGWMFGGYGLQILVQAAYFILVARTLGARQYGAFVAVTALVSIAAPFSGFGAANLLVKNVARDRNLMADYWGNGLLMICATGCGFLVILLGSAKLLLPDSVALTSLLVVGISDLILVKVADLAAVGFQAIEKMSRSAQLQVLTSVFRLGGIVFLRLFVTHPTAKAWAFVYLFATGLTAAIAIFTTSARIGWPHFALHRIRPELLEGFYFSTSLSAQTIYNDIDKTMLARMVTLDAAGIYAAAYRIIDVAFTPVRSLLNAAYPRFFRHGTGGIHVSLSFSLRLIRPAAVYSLAAAIAMFAGATLLPRILGAQFSATAEALRWLALLPLLKSLHYFMGEALTGAGHQGVRASAHVTAAIFNILVNLWIIPHFGWRGAAWSSLASDGLLVLLMLVAVLAMTHLKSQRTLSKAPQ